MGIGNTHRRITLDWLPSNKDNPLVRKAKKKNKRKLRKKIKKIRLDQRSYRSLGEDFGSNVHSNGGVNGNVRGTNDENTRRGSFYADSNDNGNTAALNPNLYLDEVENQGHDNGYDQDHEELGIEDEEEEEEFGDDLSRTISLPSRVSETPELTPPDVNWIMEEHGRRYSSRLNSDEDNETEIRNNLNNFNNSNNNHTTSTFNDEESNLHNREIKYNDFINKIQNQKQNYNLAMEASGNVNAPRRASLISLSNGTLIPNVIEDIGQESLKELSHAHVTFKSEVKILASYSLPLTFTFLLEDIFPLVCSLTVGHLGKHELAAVSLASMTSNITLGFFEGMATSLDTLCPQAYGSGRYHSVGIQLQRCIAFSMAIYLPFALFWWFSEPILYLMVPERELVHLTSQFLRVLILGAPPYILFENLKRFLQAQGIFDAGIYILAICAPINVLLSYSLVWNKYIGVGFIGSAIAVVINFWLMFTLMLCYIIFIDGRKCWGGFSKKALTHWKDLSKLAFSGIVMLEAEELSYECLTIFSASFGTEYLATQSAVSSVAALIFMIPFSIGISTSTRIANFIGAGRTDLAHISSKVGLSFSFFSGLLNCSILFFGRNFIASIFSRDESVRYLIRSILPVVGFVQFFDSLNAVAGACLRGQGMQYIGSIVNFLGYYFFGIPIALFLSFSLNLKLYGLWIGIGLGMLAIGSIEAYFVLFPNWQRILDNAERLRKTDEDSDLDDDNISISSSSSSSDDDDDDDDDDAEYESNSYAQRNEPNENSPLLHV